MPVRTIHRPRCGEKGETLSGPARLLLGVLLPLFLLLGGCAYFNTFYHAKKFYGQAEATREEETRNAVSNIAGGRSTASQSGRSNDLYRKCIEKCEKVIRDYPGSKWEDDAFLLMGRAYYGKGDYLSARRELTRFPERFPESDLVPEAMFWEGVTALAQDDFLAAMTVWDELLESYPDYEDRENVEYYLAEATERQDRPDDAIGAYEEFLARYPKGERAVAARLQLGGLLLEQKRYPEAEEMFTLVATKAPDDEDRLAGRLRLGETMEAQDRYQEALDLYLDVELWLDPNVRDGRLSAEDRQTLREAQLAAETAAHQDSLLKAKFDPQQQQQDPTNPDAERDDEFEDTFAADPNLGLDEEPDGQPGLTQGQTGQSGINAVGQTGQTVDPLNPNQSSQRKTLAATDPKYADLAKVLLREGIVLAELGRPWEAVLAFEQVVAEYPRTPYAAEAQYRIGYTQEVMLEDFDLAQKSYNAVASHGRSSFIEDAGRRAKNLNTVKNLLSAAGSDSANVVAAQAAQARFLRAELYLFQQDKPERALEEYEAIEKEFVGTDQEPKAALAVAWVRMTALGDTARGRAKYMELMRNFPDTEYGRRATRLLKGPEREPLPTDFAGPTVDELRAPENLAAIALRDSLLAAAEPPPPEADEFAGAPGDSLGAGGPGGTPPGADSPEAAGRSTVSDKQRMILERMRRGAGPDSTGGAMAAGPGPGGMPDTTRAGPGPGGMPDTTNAEPGSGMFPDPTTAPSLAGRAPGGTTAGAGNDSTVTPPPVAGPRPVTPTPGTVTPSPEAVTPTPGTVTPSPEAVTPTPGTVTPSPETMAETTAPTGERARGPNADSLATAARTAAERVAGATPAETAAEMGADSTAVSEPPAGHNPAETAETAENAAAATTVAADSLRAALPDTLSAVPEALPPPEDVGRRPLPRGPSGKYLNPWAAPRAGWSPVLDGVPTDSTTVVPPEPAPAGGPGGAGDEE